MWYRWQVLKTGCPLKEKAMASDQLKLINKEARSGLQSWGQAELPAPPLPKGLG